MAGRVRLIIVDGPMKGKEFVFDEHDNFLFGRDEDCHAQLPNDSYVSRHHFIIEAAPPEARLRDLGSMNGTFVNEVLCGARREGQAPEDAAHRIFLSIDLHTGDRIHVGQTVIDVEVEHGENLSDTLRSPICVMCGSEAPRELRGSGGAYVCAACGQRARSDPDLLPKFMGASDEEHFTMSNSPSFADIEVGEKIGQGGMAIVYKGRDRKRDRVVALKLMISPVAVDRHSIKKFLREMEIMEDLQHENIVRFFGGGCMRGIFYFVMDYCDAGTLLQLKRSSGGKISGSAILPPMRQVLRAMSFAHQKGYVHRDIKPLNILLKKHGEDYTALVSDFGLSKNFEQAGISGMTATGDYAGSLRYMPKEQIVEYKYLRPASDVWSIGAAFYSVLTNAFPREFKRGVDPIRTILDDVIVPIDKRVEGLPGPLARIINRSILSDPEKRYPSAKEFLEDFEDSFPG